MQPDTQQITKINVVYATQTGTSYDLAKQFVLLYSKKFIINKFIDIALIQNFQQSQSDCLWLFFISTTGQGDFPYSMRKLWKKMLSKLHPTLNWMKFSIYSLGDRSYGDNFCMAARKFRQRLIGLQAAQVIQIGLGDQQQSNGYFQQYKDKWLPNILKYMDQQIILTKQSILNDEIEKFFKKDTFLGIFQKQNNLKLIDRKQICSNKDRRVFTVDIQLIDYPQKISTGDILSIYPHNNPQDVEYLMNHFKLTKEIKINSQHNQKQTISLNQLNQQNNPKNTSQNLIPANITYYELFTSYLNISSTLNHSFFISRSDIQPLSYYCEDPLFKQKLVQLQNDYEQFHNYIRKYKRNVVQVFKDFELKTLPLQDFVKRCGHIISRKYSISKVIQNSNDRKVIRILFKLVKDKVNQNRVNKGLCSHDMAVWTGIGDIRKGTIIKGQFQYIEKTQNNIIFITLGTGIAPFIQFFDLADKSQNQWNMQVFYTNRYQNQIYFQSELSELVAQNKLNPFLSFTGQGGKRIIRLIQDNTNTIRQNFINKYGIQGIKIMICGPKQMCQGLQNILARQLGVDIKQLKKKKILIYQNW